MEKNSSSDLLKLASATVDFELHEGTHLDALPCDSLEFLDLVKTLEDAGGHDVPLGTLTQLKTVGELIEAVQC